MAWNLINTLNSDLEKGNVFDDLPETSQKLAAQAKVPSTQEIAPPPSFDSGPVISRPVQLNGSTDIGQSEVLAPPKDVASLGKSEGVFDSIPPVNERVRSPFKESDLPAEVSVPANGRVNGTPRELTLGESFQKAKGVLQQMDAYHKAHNYGSARDRGINTAQYEAAKNEVMSQLGDFLENTYGIAKTDVPSLFVGLTKTAAGFRTAQEIDEIHDIVKNGAVYTNLQGEQVSLPRNSNWGNALTAYDDRFTANIHKKPEKPVEDKTVDEIAKLNTTRDGVNAMPEGPSKTALLEVLDKKENDLTGGKANYNRHVAMENNISTALASSNDRNLNYRGLRFDSPEAKEDPKGQLSGNDFLIEAAGNGSLPTVTIGKDGFNTSAADDYLKKHGVDSTPVGIWESGKLNAYRFTPSAEKGKQFVPIMVKGPEVAKKSVDGNPFAALSDELNAKDEVNRANNSREENEKKYVQLVQDRKELLNPEPKQEDRIQFGGGGVTRLRGSRTPQEEAQEKRNSWDKQSARIQAVEKQLGTFDPEGSGYDIKTAVAAGMEPDSKTKHWGSVRKSTPDEIKKYGVPEDSYLLLKGAKHPTHNLAVQYEAQRGFEIKKIGDRYFSIPVKK